MMTYKEERRQFWQKIMEEWKESGLSGAAYCRQKGCSKANFFRWKKKFSDEEISSSAFVPLKLAGDQSNRIRIVLGSDIEVSVGASADGACVGRVVSALQSVC